MSMNVLRAQAFVQMVSVSTQMGLFAVNAQWVTTWITLEYAVWVSVGSTLLKVLFHVSYSSKRFLQHPGWWWDLQNQDK